MDKTEKIVFFSLIVIAILLLVIVVICCSPRLKPLKYDEDWIIGKTSIEIVNKYGEFDCELMPVSEDGFFKKCRCGYTIKEPQTGYLGTSPEILYFITFDKNGVAIECTEGYRPGG